MTDLESSRPTPRAVCFDLDETLLDNSGIPASVAQTCAELASTFRHLDATRLLEANSVAWSEYWPMVEEQCWLGQKGGFEVSREAWRRTLHACRCDDDAIVDHAFTRHRRLGRNAFRLFHDVEEFLRTALEIGIPLAIVTNGPSDFQREKLEALGIRDAFASVVISGDIGVAKPDPIHIHAGS